MNPKFVFDTNVLISALLFNGSKPDQAFKLARKLGKILESTMTLDELQLVISRPKFDRYVDTKDRQIFFNELSKEIEWVEINITINDCLDPKDNKFLELAWCGKATLIVSGDSDLLKLNPFRGIPILTVDQFLVEMRKTNP